MRCWPKSDKNIWSHAMLYVCPVWSQSSHAKQVVTLNDTVKLITGYLKPTLIDKIQILSGITLFKIRRKVNRQNRKR